MACLLLEGGEGVTEHGVGVRAGDLHRLHLDALLVLHRVGLGAGVLGVLVGGAAAVIEHGDHGGTAGLVHGHVQGGGTSAHAGEGRGEGGGGGNEGGEGNSAHLVLLEGAGVYVFIDLTGLGLKINLYRKADLVRRRISSRGEEMF